METSDPIVTLRQAHDTGVEKLELLSAATSRLGDESNPTTLKTLREVLRFFDGELRVHSITCIFQVYSSLEAYDGAGDLDSRAMRQ